MAETPATDQESVPRLLYVGDVPVESSYHGSALLYRLLKEYPIERLRVVEGILGTSRPDRRLPGVTYRRATLGWERPLTTRFASAYSSWLTLTAPRRARAVGALAEDFAPEAILTVTHGYLWMTASAIARRVGVPLHVICHDDWPRVARNSRLIAGLIDRRFGEAYRQAASRLCVSPFMKDEYARRYGVEGTVLYPTRAGDCRSFREPPELVGRGSGTLTIAFAGTINSGGVVRALLTVAEILERLGGRLVLYGPLNQTEGIGLGRSAVICRGLLTSEALLRELREIGAVLFVPMSFEDQDRSNASLSFPSKLTDYTATALPLLILGPSYCSAVRWADENPGVAVVVRSGRPEALTEAIEKLAADPVLRMTLGRSAAEVGAGYFAAEAGRLTLHEALRKGKARGGSDRNLA